MVHLKKLFSKSLTATDIKKRLSIPTKILPSLPGFNGSHTVRIHLIYGTRIWPVDCSIRKAGYYKKPVFSRGWIDFVRRNKFNVGDELALYKVLQDEDEAESFYYRVQVENHARPFGDVSPSLSSHNHDSHEVDETPGTSLTKACESESKQEQLLKADAALQVQEDEAVTKLVNIVAADEPIALVDHVIAKPKPSSIRIFGTNYMSTHEVTSKEESKMKLHVAIACGTSTQAAGDGYYKSRNERLSLGMTLPQPTAAYAGEGNLDLTLAPPVVDGTMEDTGQYFLFTQDQESQKRATEQQSSAGAFI